MARTRKGKKSRATRPGNGKRDLAVYIREPSLKVHKFSRVYQFGSAGKQALDSGTGFGVALSSLPNFADYTTLFNQYRITGLDVEYVLQTQVISGSYPRMIFAVDYEDNSSPTSEPEMLQYENCDIFNFSQMKPTFKRSLVPRVAVPAFQFGVTTAYSVGAPGTWINCDYPSVIHYGWKHWLNNYNSTNTPTIDIKIYLRLHIECRGER